MTTKNSGILRGLTLTVALLAAAPANAKEACTDAKDLVSLVQKFVQPDPDLSDKITPKLKMKLSGLNEHAAPTALLYRHGPQEILVPLDADGQLTGFEKLADVDKNGEFCKVIDGDLQTEIEGEDTTSLNMSFQFIYPENTGSHRIDDIVEGAKDGSKIMNSLAPRGLGVMVPSLKRVFATPENSGTDLTLRLMREGQEVAMPKPDIHKETGQKLYSIKKIRKTKADTLLVEGGPYRLEATFKP